MILGQLGGPAMVRDRRGNRLVVAFADARLVEPIFYTLPAS
jgi:hypothetical protein